MLKHDALSEGYKITSIGGMTPENFCYWLQGFMEIQKPETMTKEQVDEINKHLQLVFFPVIKLDFNKMPLCDGVGPNVDWLSFTNHASC